MAQTAQEPIIAFVERTLGPECRRIDTHAASIFLAGDRAWKLKRAVRFPYLDFSTPEQRRAALEAELRLNRRTAPDLYIALHSIVRGADGYMIDAAGEAVDWLLEMRRFPDGARLDQYAETYGLDPALMLRLADRIHGFHKMAERASDSHGASDLRRVVEGNGLSLKEHEALFGPARVQQLIAAQHQACDRFAALLDGRAHNGKVRHVHGDLHLANIAMIDGEAVMFDCLEFSDELATTDVLYDLAFLLMDLWHREQHGAANILFNRYIDVSADEDGVRLLPLFLSLRATVRSHVLATTARRSGNAADQVEAMRFLDLAETLIHGAPAVAVAIGGLSGTGKTMIARAIGAEFGGAPGARILRSDVLRKRLARVAPEQRLSASFYTPLADRTVYDLLAECAARHLAHHSTIIADAVFAEADERALIARAASHARVAFAGCWLEAPLERRLERIDTRRGDASDADERVVRLQSSHAIAHPPDWIRIAAGGTPGETVAAVRSALQARLASRPQEAAPSQRHRPTCGREA